MRTLALALIGFAVVAHAASGGYFMRQGLGSGGNFYRGSSQWGGATASDQRGINARNGKQAKQFDLGEEKRLQDALADAVRACQQRGLLEVGTACDVRKIQQLRARLASSKGNAVPKSTLGTRAAEMVKRAGSAVKTGGKVLGKAVECARDAAAVDAATKAGKPVPKAAMDRLKYCATDMFLGHGIKRIQAKTFGGVVGGLYAAGQVNGKMAQWMAEKGKSLVSSGVKALKDRSAKAQREYAEKMKNAKAFGAATKKYARAKAVDAKESVRGAIDAAAKYVTRPKAGQSCMGKDGKTRGVCAKASCAGGKDIGATFTCSGWGVRCMICPKKATKKKKTTTKTMHQRGPRKGPRRSSRKSARRGYGGQ